MILRDLKETFKEDKEKLEVIKTIEKFDHESLADALAWAIQRAIKDVENNKKNEVECDWYHLVVNELSRVFNAECILNGIELDFESIYEVFYVGYEGSTLDEIEDVLTSGNVYIDGWEIVYTSKGDKHE